MNSPNIGVGGTPEQKPPPEETVSREVPLAEQPAPAPEIEVTPPEETETAPAAQEAILQPEPPPESPKTISHQGKPANLTLQDVGEKPIDSLDEAARLQDELNATSV